MRTHGAGADLPRGRDTGPPVVKERPAHSQEQARARGGYDTPAPRRVAPVWAATIETLALTVERSHGATIARRLSFRSAAAPPTTEQQEPTEIVQSLPLAPKSTRRPGSDDTSARDDFQAPAATVRSRSLAPGDAEALAPAPARPVARPERKRGRRSSGRSLSRGSNSACFFCRRGPARRWRSRLRRRGPRAARRAA